MKRKLIVGVLLAVMLVIGGCGNRAQGNGSSEALAGTVEASEESAAESKTTEVPTLSTEPTESSKGTEETKESQKDKADGKKEGSKESESGEAKKAGQGSKASEADKPSGQESKATGVSAKESSTAASQSTKKDTGKNSGTAASSAPSPSSEENKPAAHVCDYGSGSVTTAATCTEAGVKTFTCSCGKSRTETIPAAGHSMKTDTTPATCTEAGKSKTYCTACGYVESEKATEGAKGHLFGDLVWVNPQTCSDGGYWNRSCTACGYHEGGSGEPLGHEPGGSRVSYEPTCTHDGTLDVLCARCGEVIGQENISALSCIDNDGNGVCDICNNDIP